MRKDAGLGLSPGLGVGPGDMVGFRCWQAAIPDCPGLQKHLEQVMQFQGLANGALKDRIEVR